jgi:hypothetical protein
MRWYWEGSHYTKETAKRLLDKILGSDKTHDDFGVQS